MQPNGWGTWDSRSVLSYVKLPEALGVALGIKEYRNGQVLSETLIGRRGDGVEVVEVGTRSYDGSYAELRVSWRDIVFDVRSSFAGGELLLLVLPLANQPCPATLYVEGAKLWGSAGSVWQEGSTLTDGTTRVHVGGEPVDDPILPTKCARVAVRLDRPIVVSTASAWSIEAAAKELDVRKSEVAASFERYGDLRELAEAMHTCLAWDTIWDPKGRRLISPVSRIWCGGHGGWVLFCWDTFFAAWMALDRDPELAKANALAMLSEATSAGFVPNYAYATGQRSEDRSQPPVGGFVVREIVEATGDLEFAELTFDALLRWNRWWPEARAWQDCLCWGSTPYAPRFGNFWETHGVGERFGAALESGLDNSPMFDAIPFNSAENRLELADVGLTALYLADCQALHALARRLGRTTEAAELEARVARFSDGLESLWSAEVGLYLNRRTDTRAWEDRLSPCHFYPLMTGLVPRERAQRMVREHLLNPVEFWGPYVLPSIARSDPAYADQEYWRGRVWAPVNFLVYLGLRRYDPAAATELAHRSAELLLREWREERHIHENYNAETGDGDDVASSDAFYHWGALLALVALLDADHVPSVAFPSGDRA